MKTNIFFSVTVFFLLVSLLLCGFAHANRNSQSGRTIEPIVSTEWLNDNMGQEDLVMIDVRSGYADGHIPGSISEPFATGYTPETGPTSNWIVGRDGLWLEVPDVSDLFVTIGNLGISEDSWVVIITDPEPTDPAPHYGLSSATRVGATLIYAGVRNVAILDGGYTKWVADGYTTTTDVPTVTPVTYDGQANTEMFVDTEYIKRHLNFFYKADIIDARDADVYYGATIEPYAPKAGHILNAQSLPAPWIWDLNSEGGYYTYKDSGLLGDMAAGVLHESWGHRSFWGYKGPRGQNIIVYCGVGGYASSWWYVLTQVLDYKNVKFYDGAAQAWAMENDMVPYQWD